MQGKRGKVRREERGVWKEGEGILEGRRRKSWEEGEGSMEGKRGEYASKE